MTTDPATILRDLMRAALEDCDVLLPPITEQRLVDRISELADLAGVTIEVDHPNTQP